MQTGFSVIIPTHNRASLVVRAIESALAAGAGEALEVIVVDDGSTDLTSQLLSERYAIDTRVRIVRLDINKGPSIARNVGLGLARGEYVLFLDSDDAMTPDVPALARCVFAAVPALQFVTFEGESLAIDRVLANHHIVHESNPGWHGPGFDAQCFSMHAIAGSGPSAETFALMVGDCLPAIVFGDLFYLSGLVMRRHAAHKAGPFRARFRYLEDWEFAARLCLLGPGGYLDAVGFQRETTRADQLSRAGTDWRRATMHQHVLTGVRDTCFRLRRSPPSVVSRAQSAADYSFGRCINERGHPCLARGYFLRSLKAAYKPLKCVFWLIQGFLNSFNGRRGSRGTRHALMTERRDASVTVKASPDELTLTGMAPMHEGRSRPQSRHPERTLEKLSH